MTRILVTGAAGFVGQHVLDRLRGSGHDWDAPARGTRLDRAALPGEPPDAIIHLAAHAHVGRSLAAPRETIENNVASLLTVLDYARAVDARIVHLSTDEALWPRNPYGASKAAQEAICEAYRASYELDVVVARADLIVGPGQPDDKFVPSTIRALRAGDPVTVYARHSNAVRRWQGVTNAADGLVWCATTPKVPPVVHLGGVPKANREMALLVALTMGCELTVVEVERPDVRGGSRTSTGYDLTGAGWREPSTLEADLRAMLDA